MFDNLKFILDKSTELGVPAMELLIYHNGEKTFHEVRGVRDEEGNPLRENERFNSYSCSKPITCAAALTLLEKGKISLDDDLSTYIPAFGDVVVAKNGGFFKAENSIKLRHLFTMTSGLNYNTNAKPLRECKRETDGRCPTVLTMDYLARVPLSFEPGERWLYSLSHDVIAAVVEIVSGKRFGEYVREKIFMPCGMTDSTFLLPEDEVATLPLQYVSTSGGVKPVDRHIDQYKFGTEYESGGAGCITTAGDYVKFLEAMRCEKILSRETLDVMYSDQLNAAQRAYCWAPVGYSYGLGVRVPDASGRRSDIGWGGAAGAFLALDEKNSITLYYAQHVLSSPNKDLRKDLIEAAKLDLGYDAFVEDMNCGKGSFLA